MAAEGIGLPFREAIDFFERKVNLPTQRSDDLRHEAHVRAFSVAGVTRDDMLADFRAAIQKAIAKGTGFKEFQRDFDSIVEGTGWSFYAPGDTEEKRRAWRAGVIYRTNMRTSYMAGRHAQMTEPAVLRYRPFWRYRHGDSRRPRPHHLALDNKVFAANDPIWRVIYPPNGWGCSCDVEPITKRQLAAMGKDGPDEKPDWLKPGETNDPRTGAIEEQWPGIDRGWDYNVGEASRAGLVPLELQTPLLPAGEPVVPLDLPPMPEPTPVPPERFLPSGLEGEAYSKAFLAEFGASADKPQIWRDPSGGVITISEALFETRDRDGTVVADKATKNSRGPYLLLMADAIKEPDEIWVDWASVASGFALRRSYLKRFLLPGGRQGFVRFEWTAKGWIGVTAFPSTVSYLERFRRGALLFRRK